MAIAIVSWEHWFVSLAIALAPVGLGLGQYFEAIASPVTPLGDRSRFSKAN